uniref:DUF3615 domain-containing protein n=1 Tax=Oryza punctata TaxID=4537 RepID=A0A0E0LCW8_ORYPU
MTSMEKDAPPPAPVRYCGVLEDYEQQVDEEPPSPKSPSRVSSPLPLPEQKVSAAYRAELRPKNALINNGPARYRFRRPGEKRRRRRKKHNKSKQQVYTPPPPPSPRPRPSPPSPLCPYEEYPTFEPDDPVWMRQSVMYPESALEHYNAAVPGNGGVKYELVRAIFSGAIFTCKAAYGHVNFIARAIGSSHEQLFFAEVRKDKKRYIPTCLWSLDDEADRVGGAGTDPQGELPEITSPSRRNYCFSCDDEMKHPKDGESYHAGHFL